MKKMWSIYSSDIPDVLLDFANTPAMLRLKDIGMNCGCEYTKFKYFTNCEPYSRYDHSMGVALIIWHFTKNKAQSIAGLFHDIATPVFAHTIDFMNGEHEKQESTEEKTEEIIAGSKEIVELLKKHNIQLEEVCDYHIYPIADNKSPKLSADRLEYSLGNMVNYGFESIERAKAFYNDLIVAKNEDGETELVFQNEELAKAFTKAVLKNSKVYVSDEDRFAMQRLADIVKYALEEKIVSINDLHKTESYFISKLTSDKTAKALWSQFISYSKVKTSKVAPTKLISSKPVPADDSDLNSSLDLWMNISAKKRYINPYVQNKGRLCDISEEIAKEIKAFTDYSFDYWIGIGN